MGPFRCSTWSSTESACLENSERQTRPLTSAGVKPTRVSCWVRVATAACVSGTPWDKHKNPWCKWRRTRQKYRELTGTTSTNARFCRRLKTAKLRFGTQRLCRQANLRACSATTSLCTLQRGTPRTSPSSEVAAEIKLRAFGICAVERTWSASTGTPTKSWPWTSTSTRTSLRLPRQTTQSRCGTWGRPRTNRSWSWFSTRSPSAESSFRPFTQTSWPVAATTWAPSSGTATRRVWSIALTTTTSLSLALTFRCTSQGNWPVSVGTRQPLYFRLTTTLVCLTCKKPEHKL